MVNSECSIVNGFSAKGGVFLSRAYSHEVDVIRGMALAEELALKDKDITLST